MGGWEQIDKLIRKNVILKARRPKATCFEFSLPLVLFAILVFVRKRFDRNVEVLGPFSFGSNPVFPLSGALLEMAGWGPDGDASSFELPKHLFMTQVVCAEQPPSWVEGFIKPSMYLEIGDMTLMNHVLQSDPQETASVVSDAVEAAKAWNVDEIVSKLRTLRDSYFRSELPGNLEEAATAVDEHLMQLQEELPDLSRRGQVEDHVRQWLNDTCHLRGDVHAHWNADDLAELVHNLHEVLEETGAEGWLRGARRLQSRGSSRYSIYDRRRRRPTGPRASLESLYDEDPSIHAAEIATYADKNLWWLSHFVRSDWPVSMLLDIERLPTFVAKAEGSPPAPHIALDTELGESLYENLWHLQQELASSDARGNDHGNWRRLSSISSISSLVSSVLDDLAGATPEEIAHDIFPRWRSDWQQACQGVDVDKVATMAGEMHAKCPFYRKLMDSLHEPGIVSAVQKIHSTLRDLDLDGIAADLQRIQDSVMDVNGTELSGSVRRILDQVQSKEERRSEWVQADVDRVTRDLWHGIHAELRKHTDLTEWCGAQAARRLQREDGGAEDGEEASGKRTILDYIDSHKFLIAPYRGEVVKLWKLAIAEFVAGATASASENSFFWTFLKCPLVKAQLAQVMEDYMDERSIYFNTEAEMDAWADKHQNMILLAVVFRSADDFGTFAEGPLNVQYVLRMHSLVLPGTASIISQTEDSMFGAVETTRYPYIDFGIAYLQDALGRASARLAALREKEQPTLKDHVYAKARTDPIREMAISLQQFPAPEYLLDRFINIIQRMLPFIMILGWIYALSLLAKEIVYEKQERLREVMRVMGLRTWVYWTSWTLSAMSQMTVLVAASTLMMCAGGVLKHSNPILVFAFFWLYSLSIVSLAMLISACFSRAKVAAVCAGVIYYVLYLPYTLYPRFEDSLSMCGKFAFCTLSPTAMGIGMSIIAKWELEQDGLQWQNIGSVPPVTMSGALPQNDFSLAHVLLMFLVDTCVYQILAWYIEKVFPGSLGLPQPFYFFLLPSYWRPVIHEETLTANTSDTADMQTAEELDNSSLECWEACAADAPVLVHINKLAKKFPSGKQALKGITLNLHEGTILSLLGHNGAGKSTTMAILTGLYPPSSGDVLVGGVSVRRDSHKVRKQLGVCLQQNALYETMTVEEHLNLFCRLKGVARRDLAKEVSCLLDSTGLRAKAGTLSRALSGGMKRKLSIGLALAGGSRIVALDEPTAGVDAVSRRDIWHLLAKSKSGRAILLSTHFMDEADVLSDRIAIIAEGALRAVAGSMALKRRFADGYMLTVVASDGAKPHVLLDAIRTVVPEIEFAGSRGSEWGFSLPASARSCFDKLFRELRDPDRRKVFGIETYGLSASTMEEVFLQASSVYEQGLHGKVRNNLEAEHANRDWELASVDSTKSPQSSGGMSLLDTPSSSASETQSIVTYEPALNPETTKVEAETEKVQEAPELESHSVCDGGVEKAVSDGQNQEENPCGSLEADEGNAEPWSFQCMSGTLDPPPTAAVKHTPKMTASKSLELEEEKAAQNVEKATEEREKLVKLRTPLLQGLQLRQQQFLARICSRAKSAARDRKAWASQVLLPVTFVVLALVIAQVLEVIEHEPALKLDTDMFEDEHTLLFQDTRGDEVGRDWTSAFERSRGHNDEFAVLGSGSGDIADYLVEHHRALLFRSYGAASMGKALNMANTTLWFKNRALHVVPAMMNWCNNARLKLLGLDAEVQAWNHPLPKTEDALLRDLTGQTQMMTDLTVSVTVILAMGFIPASFVVHLVHEKSTHGKHQQLLTGVSAGVYWLSSYCWDLINFLVPTLLCFALFLVFQLNAYSGENSSAILFLLLSYGACMTPLMYCLEPLFTVPSTAYVVLICLNVFTGTVSVLATTILDMYESDLPDVKPLNSFCKAIFPWLLPNYNLGRGMIELATNHYKRWLQSEFDTCPTGEGTCNAKALDWDVTGRFLFSLVAMSGVWFLVRLLLEWGVFSRLLHRAVDKSQMPSKTEPQDFAVCEEEGRVAEALSADVAKSEMQPLLISDLCKTWGGRSKQVFHSVKGVSVGVARGECFGLLGVNGAGKTTTMRMITGDIDITRGDVLLNGWSIKDQRDKARRHLGYCPQFDALPDKLTVRETLFFYARVRGVPAAQTCEVVKFMTRRMCLEAHQNQLCQHLSGGNKRKLSTAIALIGEPDVVLLDEPSTGIDVGARRFLWDILGDIRLSGHALVLTSHSMDECDVLCTRLTIMAAGEFRCLGTPLQLKDRFGGGYTLCIKAQPSKCLAEEVTDEVNEKSAGTRISSFVQSALPRATLLEANVGLLRYRLLGGSLKMQTDDGSVCSSDAVNLAEVFRTLEKALSETGCLNGCVSDYTISQTSLEEVFLHFSHHVEGQGEVLPKAGWS